MQGDPQGLLAAASAAIQAGELGQAEALCHQLLSAQPANGGAKLVLAHIRRLVGDFDGAAGLAEEAGRKMPRDPAPRLEAALAHSAAGRHAQAETAARKAIRLRAGFAPPLQVLAEVLMRAGNLAESLAVARRAAVIDPRDPLLRLNIASVLRQSGNLPDALAECDAALAIAGDDFLPALRFKGELLTEQRDVEQAVAVLARAARLAPGDYDTRFACGNALYDAQRFEEAIVEFEAAGQLRPDLTEADYNRARALMNLDRIGEAEVLLMRCLERVPGEADVYKTVAMVYGMQNRIPQLFEICDRGIARCENPWNLWQMKADWSLILGRTDDCLAFHAQARAALPPGDSEADAQLRVVYALVLLALGRFDEGWPAWRARRERTTIGSSQPGFAIDPSALPPDLSGKRILIVQEQGIGDEIFYLRYAPLLHKRGARLCYQGEPKMHTLLRGRGDLFHRLLAPEDRADDSDISLLSGDLPEATGGEVVTPLRFEASAALVGAWAARLAELGPPPYIGVTWSAGLGADVSFRLRRPVQIKQVPEAQLARALRAVPGTAIVLQRNPLPGSLARFQDALGRPAHDFSALNERLDDMLAVLRLLDEYVCVSNANAHFAASLGLACRVLVMRWPEWRWRAKGERSPWFPGFRLYRQQAEGSWDAPLRQLEEDLCRQ